MQIYLYLHNTCTCTHSYILWLFGYIDFSIKRTIIHIFCTEVHLNIGIGKQLAKIKPTLGTTITGVTVFTTIIFSEKRASMLWNTFFFQGNARAVWWAVKRLHFILHSSLGQSSVTKSDSNLNCGSLSSSKRGCYPSLGRKPIWNKASDSASMQLVRMEKELEIG